MATSKKSKTEGSGQQELTKFDENLGRHFEQMEDNIFNHKERLQQLEEGKISQTNTILSAVFQEIKKQSDMTNQGSTKIHFFKVKPRLLVFCGTSLVEKVRLFRNPVTVQRSMETSPEDPIAYHHSGSTRFPVG